MKKASIVAPKPICGFSSKKVIYIPCDIHSRLLSFTLRKLAQAEINLDFGFVFRLQGSAVLFQALGAPMAALALEPLIVSGAREIILLGFCGSLSVRFQIGDAISVSKAFSEEGTSRHYFPRKRLFSSSPSLKKHLERDFRASGLDIKTGTIVSTDAPFRETISWMRKNQKRGAELVDMETSAIFALAEFHGIRAASLQIVSDELSSGKWKTAFSSPQVEDRVKNYFLPLLIRQN